ncbi:DUF6691 family protein [Desulfosoma caldarium]|uniref:Thiosulfate/3-mercaptopyruvate sulfurtransferase n=1 Tax=Desulfosoma caldarium TaxID=610254 RepID=A0A3N1ULV1_9BACT|nr:DUF6691 family protein [Desulfosoma caldarium]ROQ92194.1 thiosulfate/3-mercaptopyruvate sulfurtransferase [Desulfosoma caldarium]
MIETLFSTDLLHSGPGFLAAFIVGLLFGLVLERAGFGSSRRIAGVFYLTDMAVIKVMFTALVTAAIGLAYASFLGLVGPENLYVMPTVYGAQIVGGLIFGVGFALSGWCPGTSLVGAASGKLDAVVFFVGAILGSIVFNELYPSVEFLYNWGSAGVRLIYESAGISLAAAVLVLSILAVMAFWVAETVEEKGHRPGVLKNTRFFRSFCTALIILAVGLFITPSTPPSSATSADSSQPVAVSTEFEKALMASIEAAADHIEPEELANRIMGNERGLLVVDVRPAVEYQAFHIRGAVNIGMAELADQLAPYRNRGLIVLYSNGMTHPAQARDSLYRQGFRNVYILSEGLTGFMERCLKPASLRTEPLDAAKVAQINAWRNYFQFGPSVVAASVPEPVESPETNLPGIVSADWVQQNLGRPGLVVIDLRGQEEYNRGHIPGSMRLDLESLRGVVGGVPSRLMPVQILAAKFSLMGLQPDDVVVLATDGKPRDATLVGMALERMGHTRYALMETSVAKWHSDGRPWDQALPTVTPSEYPVDPDADTFTVEYQTILAELNKGRTVILDVRPVDYYTGAKSDEARAGHIPGAVNRPFTEDLVKNGEEVFFKPLPDLAKAYEALIPDKNTPVIVHCRTGHQASQTWFVLKRLLGYTNVRWYDASWTEWAARPELPVATGASESKG